MHTIAKFYRISMLGVYLLLAFPGQVMASNEIQVSKRWLSVVVELTIIRYSST